MAKDLFNESEKRQIVEAIVEAEKQTSGEIRLHVENHCKGDVLDRAAELFSVLHMHETKLRNGVLFYLAAVDHKFAIIGDMGINQKVENHFWGDIKEHMTDRFKSGSMVLGLCEGIKMAGHQLKQHFPAHENDVNELSNEISFGSN